MARRTPGVRRTAQPPRQRRILRWITGGPADSSTAVKLWLRCARVRPSVKIATAGRGSAATVIRRSCPKVADTRRTGGSGSSYIRTKASRDTAARSRGIVLIPGGTKRASATTARTSEMQPASAFSIGVNCCAQEGRSRSIGGTRQKPGFAASDQGGWRSRPPMAVGSSSSPGSRTRAGLKRSGRPTEPGSWPASGLRRLSTRSTRSRARHGCCPGQRAATFPGSVAKSSILAGCVGRGQTPQPSPA